VFGLVTIGRGGSLAKTEYNEIMKLWDCIFGPGRLERPTFLLSGFEGCNEYDHVFGFWHRTLTALCFIRI